MDNTNNNDIDDINYKLYRKVFNNKFLRKIIYDKVYELNYKQTYESVKNIYNCNLDKAKLNSIINKKKYSYEYIPYNIIFQHGLVSIFKDKIKTKTKSYVEISCILLSNFLGDSIYNRKNNNNNNNNNNKIVITKEEFESFYLLNKEVISKNNESTKRSDKRVDIFEMFVENKVPLKFLKVIYNNEIEFVEKEKQLYYLEKDKQLNNNDYIGDIKFYDSFNFIIGNLQLKNEFQKSSFLVYSNFELVKTAFQRSSIEIIKFLNEIQVDFQHYQSNLLYWSIMNDRNRNELVNWLLDEFGYKVPTVYNGVYSDFYKYLCKLDYKTFKRVVVKEGSPMLIGSDCYSLFPNYIIEHRNGDKSFNIQIDLMLISVLSIFQLKKSIEYMVILKIIKQLLKYNKNPSEHLKINSNSIRLIIEKVYNKYYKQQQQQLQQQQKQKQKQQHEINQKENGSSIFNSIYSFYKILCENYNTGMINQVDIEKKIPHTLKELKNGNYNMDYFTEFSNIDYNQFNLEREIKRIYILEFLNTSLFSNLIVQSSIIYFIIKFDCFSLLEFFLKNNNSGRKHKIEQEIMDQILVNSNFNTYIYIKKNKLFESDGQHTTAATISNNNNNNNFSITYYFSKKNIKFYMDFLLVMCDYNDINFGLIFTKVLVILDNESDIDLIEKMIKILEKYQVSNKTIDNEITKTLIGYRFNKFLSLYLYKNHGHCFVGDWETNIYVKDSKKDDLFSK